MEQRADAVASLRGGLIVSCQAYPGEAMRHPSTMAQVAQAVVAGGATAVRLQGLEDIMAARGVLSAPIIGLWKDGDAETYITPTLDHALAVARAGADIVALDGTRRPRPDGLTFAETVRRFRDLSDLPLMADCGCLEDALAAEAAGVDLIGTTLGGYTGDRPRTEGPDFELVDQIVAHCQTPVIVEGRVHTPAHAVEAFARGAYAVCAGSAITHPSTITSWFVQAVAQREKMSL